MVDGESVVPVDLSEARGADVSSLDVVGDEMLLVADQQVLLHDGATWRDLEAPLL